jgi:hypothetical protein
MGMRRKEQLTIKQKKLVEALAVAKNQTEAGRMAGYATKQATSNALNRIRVNAPEVLEQLGFSLEVVIDKYLRPGLEAMETKFFAHQGEIVSTRNVINWNARHRYLDTYFTITGAYQHAADSNDPRDAPAFTLNLALIDPATARALLADAKGSSGPDVLADKVHEGEGRTGSGEPVQTVPCNDHR